MYKKLRKHKRVEHRERQSEKESPPQDATDSADATALLPDLQENIKQFSERFGEKSDLVVRRMNTGDDRRAVVLYLECLTDETLINDFVIQPLQKQFEHWSVERHDLPPIREIHLSTNQLNVVKSFEECNEHLIKGDCLVLFADSREALAASTPGGERRAVAEATNELVVRGPREAFNEVLQTNLGLIRRRVRTPNLQVEKIMIGNLSRTPAAILYIHNLAGDKLVNEVKSRLAKIEIDGVLDSQYLEEMIEDRNGYTPFPTIFNTERPDRISAGLLEGRVAILVEGTPVGLLVPATLPMFLYANEDYYQRYDIATFLRLLRTGTFFLSILLPGFYIAVLSYHQEMIPTPLLIAFTGQREGVPFDIAVEVAFMEMTFEILREAGIRLPKTIGTAVSIVGGLVLGQAAVEAGFVASGTVIAVSATAIASFCTPAYEMAIAARLLRFLIISLCAVLGAFGFFFGIILVVAHLNTLRSFGENYLSPIVPFKRSGWRDLLVRVSWRRLRGHAEENIQPGENA
ncbi:spore germination protein [Tumebacillus sp. DT12]|uniref:Spore germination protein n=1 Tax=Tumebacillus lacus TaxID=2995335 RepID=A0ABT3X3T9_9BACL|nr:spore germination protein [Tumebacillus lacus]MCX7570638.1 spore germination protein [Tumebacillus lacus]